MLFLFVWQKIRPRDWQTLNTLNFRNSVYTHSRILRNNVSSFHRKARDRRFKRGSDRNIRPVSYELVQSNDEHSENPARHVPGSSRHRRRFRCHAQRNIRRWDSHILLSKSCNSPWKSVAIRTTLPIPTSRRIIIHWLTMWFKVDGWSIGLAVRLRLPEKGRSEDYSGHWHLCECEFRD